MSLIGSTNEEKIWNYLKAKGLPDCGIAGLMGNLYAESCPVSYTHLTLPTTSRV